MIKDIFIEIKEEIISLRKKIHSNPELLYEEFDTMNTIEEYISKKGFTIHKFQNHTGLVAIYDSKILGPTIAFRAELDGLPLDEEGTHLHISKKDRVMHACGHDGHIATLLAFSSIIDKLKHKIRGKIILIFQPAEEGGHGSVKILESGLLKDVDAIFAYHNWPDFNINTIHAKEGGILAGSGRFEIEILGNTAHLALPELAVNPTIVGSEIVCLLESLRKQYKTEKITLNTICIFSGELSGRPSDIGKIIGVYYISEKNQLSKIEKDIENILKDVEEKTKAKISFKTRPFHKLTINDAKVFKKFQKALDKNNINLAFLESVIVFSEDFSEYLLHIPGCHFFIGSGKNSGQLHTSKYDFNDEIIEKACEIFWCIALEYLAI